MPLIFRYRECIGIKALLLASAAEQLGFYVRIEICEDGLPLLIIHSWRDKVKKR